MSSESAGDPSALECLSALSDGELDSARVTHVCGLWRDDPSARSVWHAYQLIGDVLRSEDLAFDPRHDVDFLARLRTRLADEPTVLAPQVAAASDTSEHRMAARHANASRGSRWTWMAPSAVAAGFVLVAGALIVTRGALPGASIADSLLARAGVGTAAPQVISAPALTASETTFEPETMRVTGKVIRDSRLDRYLAAHQQFAGTTALGVPSGFLRNAAAEMPSR